MGWFSIHQNYGLAGHRQGSLNSQRVLRSQFSRNRKPPLIAVGVRIPDQRQVQSHLLVRSTTPLEEVESISTFTWFWGDLEACLTSPRGTNESPIHQKCE